jgi:hypothetical protein
MGKFRLAGEVDKNYALLGYYASSGNLLSTFRHNLSAHCLSQNVGKKLPLLSA